MNKLRYIVLMGHRQLGQQYSCFFEGWLWQLLSEDSLYIVWYGRVIYNNNLEGKQSYNVQEVYMQPFEN